MSAAPARRPFGNTGLTVPTLGFGAGGVGDPALSERDAETLLNSVLDLGIGLIDTARSYGTSEERIGRHLARRRGEFVLSTKVGYSVPGFEDWTAACVSAGVDLALQNLRTDVIDVVHLHSCPRATLERSGVAEALGRAVETGKVRVAAYSGDGDPLDFAVASGSFGSVQTSVNVVDQRAIETGGSHGSSHRRQAARRRSVTASKRWSLSSSRTRSALSPISGMAWGSTG